MKENYDFEIEVDLRGNKLNAIIKDNLHLNNYIFYLIKDGVLVQKQITKYVNSCTFELTDSGIYVVYGYVTSNVYKKSNSLAYFNDNLINNFENFISKPLQKSIFKEKIDVPTLDFPFQNYCLAISKNNEIIDFNSIPLNTNFISKEIYNLEKNGISIHFWGQNEPLRTENSIIIFSGYLDSKLNAEQLVSCPRDDQRIGNFAVSVISKDFCKNYNDYFGLSKFFYYESKSYFFISNCYHLLLKILTNSVFKNNLSLNIKKIRSNLCSVRHQMFQQNFSNSMLVEPIKQKSVFQEIIFDNNLKKFYFNNTSMMNSIMSNDDINIGEITKELLNNFVNFVNNNKSKFKYFDLTGGLDSRAVFALITNSPRNIQDSLFINSNSNRVEDYKIAQKLNSMYGFKPAIIHRTVQLLDAVLSDEIMRSYYMDTYYAHNLIIIKSLSPSDELQISGGLGEINCRPYYGRNFYNSYIYESISNKSYENSLSEYLSFMSDYFILESKPSFNYIIQEWKNATNVEGLSNCEKIDLLYLFYRNSYHFDTYFSTVYNSTLFYPLAHPLTFKALHAKLKKEININFQLSLIKELNPLLLMIEFEDLRDNRETQKYIDNNMRYISNLKRNFDNSDNQNLSTRHIDELSTKYKKGKELSCHYKTCIENDIKILFKRKILSKTDCISLYYFVNSCSNTRQIRELYNKLQSVIDQVLILDENFVTKSSSKLLTIADKSFINFEGKVDIWGSCVSRDIFKNNNDVVLNYIARQSIISSLQKFAYIDDSEIVNSSKFKLSMILSDINKTAYDKLSMNHASFILIDFVDERFPLLKYNSTYITKSNELCESFAKVNSYDSLDRTYNNGILMFNNIPVENYVAEFAKKIIKIYGNRIILHKVFLSDVYLNAKSELSYFDTNVIENNQKINRILSLYYEFMEKNIPNLYVVQATEYPAFENHKWGLSPMHFVEEYYREIMKQINEVVQNFSNNN